MAVVGIIPAAGSGERLGAEGPKAFVVCGGRPLLDWSLQALGAVCDRVVVAVPPGHEQPPDRIAGGASRSASVRAALAVAPEAELVVVHDAARPLVTEELVRRCIESLDGVDGAIAAARVTDTIKQAQEGHVIRTLDRNSLWAVQTPQVFRAGTLRAALDTDDALLAEATDDASLVERQGGKIRIVEAPKENLKVTTKLDLMLAEQLLANRRTSKPAN